jgi:hypothetical protein
MQIKYEEYEIWYEGGVAWPVATCQWLHCPKILEIKITLLKPKLYKM